MKILSLALLGLLSALGLWMSFAQVRSRRVTAPAGGTITVKAGGNLQAAIDAARPGDTIVVEAGATFTGPFVLPNKPAAAGTDTDYVTVRSSRLAELPEGVRVTPGQAPQMPKLVAPGGNRPALRTVAGAHHFRFLGVEFVPADKSAAAIALIELGDDGGAGQTTMEKVPHHLLFDRCYLHAIGEQDVRRGVAMNSAHTEITNSHLSGFKTRQASEAQAVMAWNGPGPFRIVNNYLEAAGENIMFGGGDPAIPNLVPSDIEIRRNHFNVPDAWRGVWPVKNLLEFKNARRAVIDGNLFEGCWASAQAGYAVLFTVMNQGNTCTWCTVEDMTFTNNHVRRAPAGVNIRGMEYARGGLPHTAEQVKRITIRNNLFELDCDNYGQGAACHALLVGEADSVTVDRNTFRQGWNLVSVYGAVKTTNFRFTNNIGPWNTYGIHGDSRSPGNDTIAFYFPGSAFTGNVLVNPGPYRDSAPTGNFYPGVWPNPVPTGVGVDMNQLRAAHAGAASPSPTPIPTPAPTPAPRPTTAAGVPTKSITSPSSGAQFSATASITITAVAMNKWLDVRTQRMIRRGGAASSRPWVNERAGTTPRTGHALAAGECLT